MSSGGTGLLTEIFGAASINSVCQHKIKAKKKTKQTCPETKKRKVIRKPQWPLLELQLKKIK